MRLLLILLACGLLFVLASWLAVWSYGRFARRARGAPSFALPLDDGHTVLDRSVSALVAEAGGLNGLAMLSGNLDAFAIRALTARSAGRSLDLIYYIWHDDLTGGLLAHEVIAAADRGVRVRLLLDDINARGRDRVYLSLDSHPNIELRLFNPSRARAGTLARGVEMALRAFSVNRRMHNKAWIADGRIALVGGRNIGDEYFDAGEATSFRDLDVMAMGPVVRQTEEMFDAYWNSASAIPIGALAGAMRTRRRRMRLARLRNGLADLAVGARAKPYLERVRERISAAAMFREGMPVHWTGEARLIADPPEKALGEGRGNWIMAALLPVMESARHSLEITSPYFVPGAEGSARLIGMVELGVDVAVLTNSLAATDVAAVHGGYARYRGPLVNGGVRLYELRPDAGQQDLSLFGSRGASLHTKAFTVDEATGFIGSFNFDPRSATLNTEMGVLFEHPGMVEAMRALFAEETGPQMSWRVSLGERGRLRWQGDGEEYGREPEADAMRRATARIIGWLPLESQL